jgi:hypothetical protein
MPFITQRKTNWKFLLIVIILAAIVGGGALWYSKRLEKPYQPPEIKKVDETADWKTYNTEKFSFKYSDNIWQSGYKELTDRYVKTYIYFINKKIENCEAWLGISVQGQNGYEICKDTVYALEAECSDVEVVECQGPERIAEDRIELNNEFFAEREISGSFFEERIQVWYSIYDQKSDDVYCATLITLPDSQKKKIVDETSPKTFTIQECLDSFEQILKTTKFR